MKNNREKERKTNVGLEMKEEGKQNLWNDLIHIRKRTLKHIKSKYNLVNMIDENNLLIDQSQF